MRPRSGTKMMTPGRHVAKVLAKTHKQPGTQEMRDKSSCCTIHSAFRGDQEPEGKAASGSNSSLLPSPHPLRAKGNRHLTCLPGWQKMPRPLCDLAPANAGSSMQSGIKIRASYESETIFF